MDYDVHAKFYVRSSKGSAVRALTDTHGDGTDFIPSIADAGGNEGICVKVLLRHQGISSPNRRYPQVTGTLLIMSDFTQQLFTSSKL